MYTFVGRIDKIHKVLANSEVETGASYKFQLLKSLSLFISHLWVMYQLSIRKYFNSEEVIVQQLGTMI